MVLVAVILLVGGLFNLVAAAMGIARKGDLQSTIGRQLAARLGKQGAIVFWLVLGSILSVAGVALLVKG